MADDEEQLEIKHPEEERVDIGETEDGGGSAEKKQEKAEGGQSGGA